MNVPADQPTVSAAYCGVGTSVVTLESVNFLCKGPDNILWAVYSL